MKTSKIMSRSMVLEKTPIAGPRLATGPSRSPTEIGEIEPTNCRIRMISWPENAMEGPRTLHSEGK